MLATTAVAKSVVTRTSVTAKIRRRGPSSAPVDEDSTSLSNISGNSSCVSRCRLIRHRVGGIVPTSFRVLHRNYLSRNADGYLFGSAAVDRDADRRADTCKRFFVQTFIFEFLHQRCHFRLA